MNNILNKIQLQHEEDIRFLEKMLRSTVAFEEEYVKLLKACLTSNKNPYSYIPTGYAADFHSSRSSAKFAEALHHAMCNDENYDYNIEFGIDGDDIFFEFVHYYPSDTVEDREQSLMNHINSNFDNPRYNAVPHNITIDDFIKYLGA
jgi:hypothetical protein